MFQDLQDNRVYLVNPVILFRRLHRELILNELLILIALLFAVSLVLQAQTVQDDRYRTDRLTSSIFES